MALTQIEQGMLKDGILTADAAGRLKMADGFVNAAKLGAGAARANFGAGAVLQVVQVVTTVDVTTSGSTTVTSASITPSSASNKILTIFSGSVDITPSSNAYSYLGLSRSGSSLGGTRPFGMQLAGNVGGNINGIYLDSPATTSAVTYNLSLGRGSGGTSSVTSLTGTTIILMEIAA